MKRRTIALATTLVMATAMLAGCGKTGNDQISTELLSGGEYGEVVLGDYSNLKAEKTVYAVTDEAVEDYIDELLYDYAEYEAVDRPSEEEDYVSVNMTASVGEEVLYDYTEETYDIIIGEAEFGEEIDTALTGVVAGDTVKQSVTYAADYEDEEFAGSTVDYDITVVEVTEEILPELTDEFITDTLGYESKDDMYAKVREQLEEENQEDGSYEVRENLLSQLIATSEISSYTDELYNQCKDEIEELYAYYQEMFGAESMDDIYEMFGMTQEDVEKEIVDMVHRRAVVYALAEKEGLVLSDEEFQESLGEMAADWGYDSQEDLVADYGEDYLFRDAQESKVLDFLESKAEITEVLSTEAGDEELIDTEL